MRASKAEVRLKMRFEGIDFCGAQNKSILSSFEANVSHVAFLISDIL